MRGPLLLLDQRLRLGVPNRQNCSPGHPWAARARAAQGRAELDPQAGDCQAGCSSSTPTTRPAIRRTANGPRPSRGPAPRDLDGRDRMDRKIRSIAGQAVDALRTTSVEQVFGQIKSARALDHSSCQGWSRQAAHRPSGKPLKEGATTQRETRQKCQANQQDPAPLAQRGGGGKSPLDGNESATGSPSPAGHP